MEEKRLEKLGKLGSETFSSGEEKLPTVPLCFVKVVAHRHDCTGDPLIQRTA
jgi:hypothetical protein